MNHGVHPFLEAPSGNLNQLKKADEDNDKVELNNLKREITDLNENFKNTNNSCGISVLFFC